MADYTTCVAENPKEYSKSDKCPDYKPKYEAQAVKNLKIAAWDKQKPTPSLESASLSKYIKP